MDKRKKLPEEIKKELLKAMEKEIESVSIINEEGKPLTLYEIEEEVQEIGKRYKQRMIEAIAEFESKECAKKNDVNNVEKS